MPQKINVLVRSAVPTLPQMEQRKRESTRLANRRAVGAGVSAPGVAATPAVARDFELNAPDPSPVSTTHLSSESQPDFDASVVQPAVSPAASSSAAGAHAVRQENLGMTSSTSLEGEERIAPLHDGDAELEALANLATSVAAVVVHAAAPHLSATIRVLIRNDDAVSSSTAVIDDTSRAALQSQYARLFPSSPGGAASHCGVASAAHRQRGRGGGGRVAFADPSRTAPYDIAVSASRSSFAGSSVADELSAAGGVKSMGPPPHKHDKYSVKQGRRDRLALVRPRGEPGVNVGSATTLAIPDWQDIPSGSIAFSAAGESLNESPATGMDIDEEDSSNAPSSRAVVAGTLPHADPTAGPDIIDLPSTRTSVCRSFRAATSAGGVAAPNATSTAAATNARVFATVAAYAMQTLTFAGAAGSAAQRLLPPSMRQAQCEDTIISKILETLPAAGIKSLGELNLIHNRTFFGVNRMHNDVGFSMLVYSKDYIAMLPDRMLTDQCINPLTFLLLTEHKSRISSALVTSSALAISRSKRTRAGATIAFSSSSSSLAVINALVSAEPAESSTLSDSSSSLLLSVKESPAAPSSTLKLALLPSTSALFSSDGAGASITSAESAGAVELARVAACTAELERARVRIVAPKLAVGSFGAAEGSSHDCCVFKSLSLVDSVLSIAASPTIEPVPLAPLICCRGSGRQPLNVGNIPTVFWTRVRAESFSLDDEQSSFDAQYTNHNRGTAHTAERLSNTVDYLHNDVIVSTLHDKNLPHWPLIAVDLRAQSLHLFDSIRGLQEGQVGPRWAEYAMRMRRFLLWIELDSLRRHIRDASSPVVRTERWSVYLHTCGGVQPQHSLDCGVFALSVLARLLSGLTLDVPSPGADQLSEIRHHLRVALLRLSDPPAVVEFRTGE